MKAGDKGEEDYRETVEKNEDKKRGEVVRRRRDVEEKSDVVSHRITDYSCRHLWCVSTRVMSSVAGMYLVSCHAAMCGAAYAMLRKIAAI